ncbi:MAG: hypothetical protein M1438_20230 [Deltaproteobacteria bacterium]|nr:hypothetical protein [Deltaproteobacteria bacterium]
MPDNSLVAQAEACGCILREAPYLMEIKALDFFGGIMVGAVLGVGGAWLYHRVRHWLGRSELSRLRSENRSLKRRLAEKDRHIGRMLSETERLAERLGDMKVVEEMEKQGLE